MSQEEEEEEEGVVVAILLRLLKLAPVKKDLVIEPAVLFFPFSIPPSSFPPPCELGTGAGGEGVTLLAICLP